MNFSLILILIYVLFEASQKLIILQSSSEIRIKLKGDGDQFIINDNISLTIDYDNYNFNEVPDKILINGIAQDYVGNKVFNLGKEENIITIIFNKPLNSCNLMFYNLSNILEVDLSKFDSSQVTSIAGMFLDCTSLTSINFKNFKTSSLNNMNQCFSGCIKLLTLDLSHFDTSSVTNMYGLFSSCSSLLSLDLQNFNTSSVIYMAIMFKNCSSLKVLDLSNFDTSSVLNFHGIFKYCTSLLSLNINNFNTKSATNMNHMFFGCNSLVSLNINSFSIESINNIHEMFTDFSINTIICLNESHTKIVDQLKQFNLNYKNDCLDPCFSGGNTKIVKDKNICISNCTLDGNYKFDYNSICYEKCPPNSYISGDHLCSSTEINWSVNDFFNGSYNLSSVDKDKIKDFIKSDIINGYLDLNELISGDKNDIMVKDKDTVFQVTTSDNQNNNDYEDLATIQLGECEKILKQKYDIDENTPLIIFKIEHNIPGVLIPIIGYDIFHPINKSKLNLEYCQEQIVNFQIPVSLDENNLIKYDPESEYYTDQCYSYTTENGTDIILNDRQNEYNNNNYSLCENNCSLIKYNQDSKKASCDCNIKNKEYIISDINNDKDLLSTYNFENHNSFSNMVTMKCVYSLFTKEGLSNNTGNYILIIIIISFAILSVLYYKMGNEILLKKIDLIREKAEKGIMDISGPNIHDNNNKRLSKNIKLKKNKAKRKSKKYSMVNVKSTKFNIGKSFSTLELQKEGKIDKINKNKKTYIDYELNTFSFQKALKYDKRTFLDYYKSMIKTKHPFIFSFIPIKDYNSYIIKISLFLVLFSIIYIVNALFFNEATIHKIYEDQGTYNFIFFLPKIFCSFFISHIIYILIKYFTVTERDLVDVKIFFKDSVKIISTKRKINIKYILYFSIGLGFLCFFWYYLSSFCAVYKNSQIYLIKNTIISLSISLIYPFIMNIITCSLRIISLYSIKAKILYDISKVLQLI